MTSSPAANSSNVFPYSASYLRTMIKTLLLASDGGKSMVSNTAPQLSYMAAHAPHARLLHTLVIWCTWVTQQQTACKKTCCGTCRLAKR